MKNLSIISLLVLAALPALAAPDRVATVRTTVTGLVCQFCAQGILAHFKKHPAISDVQVDFTRKVVLLEERKGNSITDPEITEFIQKSGFDPVKVERVQETFEEAKSG